MNVKENVVPFTAVVLPELNEAGPLVEWTLCGLHGLQFQVHVTVVPDAIVRLLGLKELLTNDTAAAGGVAVAVNTTGEPVSPFTLAVSVCVPVLGPSVRVTEATPLLPVTGAVEETEPLPSTAHVTATPDLALPCPSLTSTLWGVARAVLTEPVWLLPPFRAIWVALPAVAVAPKVIGEPTSPETVATVLCDPAVAPSVRETDPIPPAPVVVAA